MNVSSEYKPISAWGYFGYNLLFGIPLVGFILLIVFSFDNSNINRKNYARSFFCSFALVIIICVTLALLGFTISSITDLIPSNLNNM